MAGAQNAPPQTKQWRAWKGVNLTDARVAIDDDELAWLENAMSIGKGAIQIVRGPGDPIAIIPFTITMWGFTLNNAPVLITVHADGSVNQVSVPDGTITAVAPAGAVTPGACHFTIWRNSPILFVDEVGGYFSWDGTTFTIIDATQTGTAIAVFEGRVWIGFGRLITFTAPNTFDDFDVADGSGNVTLTDEAFPGDIRAMVSALEQLWILGAGAIEAIANVVSVGNPPDVLTTFSITNIVAELGTSSPNSARGYFRALVFLAPFGVYALAGVTPQKLSDKLDGLFEDLDLAADTPAALAIVESLPVLCFQVVYTGPMGGPRVLVLGFTQGKWFFGSQGSLVWIASVLVGGVSQAWGTDGSRIYRLFGADEFTPVAYNVVSKLYDLGSATTEKAVTKMGFEFQSPNGEVAPNVRVESESSSAPVAVLGGNTIEFITNDLGQPMILLNDLGEPMLIIVGGLILSRGDASMFGLYLGWSISGTDIPYRVQAVEMEYATTREWNR